MTTLRLMLVLLLAVAAGPARADTWRVDLLVFRYLRAVDSVGQAPFAPSQQDVIALDDAQQLAAAGITVLPESDYGLEEQWMLLRRSPQFRPLIKLAWKQDAPPRSGGPRLKIVSGEKLTVALDEGFGERQFNEVEGSVALNLGRYLHLDVDLAYTLGGETPRTWALRESRRMRSAELHHLDSPKLGVIGIINKWPQEEKADAEVADDS